MRLVEQIRTLQDFGFGLEETRPFVECLRAGHPAGDACPASLAVYRRKLAELDQIMAQLRAVREQVAAQLSQAEALLSDGPPPRCELTGCRADGTRERGNSGTREREDDAREKTMIKAEGVDEVTDATFADEVLAATLPVLVEFTADWCPPCRQIAQVLSAVAAEEAGRIRVVQLDVDTSPATTAAYGVLAMPTLVALPGRRARGVDGGRPPQAAAAPGTGRGAVRR